MPTYEFECQKCGKKFVLEESYQQHAERKEKCPHCGSKRVEQLISPVYAKTSKKS